jgi:hypothetical protein
MGIYYLSYHLTIDPLPLLILLSLVRNSHATTNPLTILFHSRFVFGMVGNLECSSLLLVEYNGQQDE